MAKYAAAIDQGTTSTRCMIFDHGGQVVAVAQKEHEQIYPKPGWVEHDPAEVWSRTRRSSTRRWSRPARAPTTSRASGSPTSARRRVVWDKTTGEPITTRSSGRTRAPTSSSTSYAKDGGQDRFQEQAGLPLATYFSGPKVRWILDNVDGAADEGRLRRPAVRQHGHLGHLEPHRRHRRRPPHHRRHERQPHDAHGPQDPGLGRGDHGRHRRPARDAARDPGVQRGLRRGRRSAAR